MSKKRELYSDVLKVLAIILVIFIHVIAGYRDKYLFINGKYYFILTFLDSFTRVAVPIFFMITGAFMLSKKTEKYSSYIKKRIPKLLIPLFLVSIFFYIYECNKNGIPLSMVDFITSFLTNGIKYHLWYMYAIILIYLLIPYLQVLIQNLDRKKLLNLIILIFVLSNVFNTIYLLSNRYNYGILNAFTLPDIFSFINYLFMGYYLSTYKIDKNKKIILFILSAISICMIPIADYLFIDGYRQDSMLVAASIFPVIPSVFTFLFFKDFFSNMWKSPVLQNIITKLSSCVIYIYLIHPYIIEKFEKDLYKYWSPQRFTSNVARIFIVTIVTFIISLLISYIIVAIQNLITKILLKIKDKK